ncbi:GNAT family N-acetyltransferase [Nocardia sp. NPDC059240]|uniref:GNAT family N-acetyltransferase n=1 Tax=Nocardia sp. NPDC059240 TaxID=3346786 RepID=UPI0036910AEE
MTGDKAIMVPVHVRDLTIADLPACAWSGTPTHLRYVAKELARVARGDADYLAICTPADLPVAIGAIDHRAEAGMLWQVTVHPALRSVGLGSMLVRAAETRMRAHGMTRSELSVEESNPRARALYERLGYVAYGREPDAWDEEAPDGSIHRYETMCTLMAKQL